MQQTLTPMLMDAPLARGGDLRADLLPIVCGGVALAVVCSFGLWFVSPPPPPAEPSIVVARAPAAPARIVASVSAASPYGGLVAFAAAPSAPASELLLRRGDPSAYGPMVAFAPDAARAAPPIVATLETAAPRAIAPIDAPLPPRREVAAIDDSAPPPPLPPARPPEFGALQAPEQPLGPSRSLGPTLAYAAPDNSSVATPAAPTRTSIFSLFSPQPTRPAGYDDHTAVYDISGRALYMPDGTKIEAHSGLGEFMDDPNHVGERLRGATPPDLYDLQLRESPFHGVTAIRLLPVGGEAAIYGRAGLLAHPFMMGDNGDSNGCVSIKDYEAFLKAFQEGKVTRLAVVAKL